MARTVGAVITMDMSPHPNLSTALLALVGKAISSVIFVEGYVQIELQGSRMSVLTSMHLYRDDARLASDEASFSMTLLACVGTEVLSVEEKGDDLIITLSDGAALEIHLADPSAGTEAFIYQDGEGRVWVA